MQQIEIRLLFESDMPSAMRLKEAAGWNQTEVDWRRLLLLEPNGCFGAVRDGRLVGTTTTTSYDKLAWIGMVLVDTEYRGQGIASKLMNVALEYLNGKVNSIKLDATTLGQPVYEKFGFQVESRVERWSGTSAQRELRSIETMDQDTLCDLLQLDQVAFAADRSQLIKALINDACVPPVLLRAVDGTLSGYALARNGTKKTYIGPVIAKDAQGMETLLDQMLNQLPEGEVYVDVSKECISDTSVLTKRGFVKERDLVRMIKGEAGRKTSPLVVAITGPEVG